MGSSLFLVLYHQPPAIKPALGANAMRYPRLAAIRARADRWSGEVIMGPALSGP